MRTTQTHPRPLPPPTGTFLLEEMDKLGINTALALPETMSEAQLLAYRQILDIQALRGAGRSDEQVERLLGLPAGGCNELKLAEPELWKMALADGVERANRITGFVACEAIGLVNRLEVRCLQKLLDIVEENHDAIPVLQELTPSKLLDLQATCFRSALTFAAKIRDQAAKYAEVDERKELGPSMSAEFVSRIKMTAPAPVLTKLAEVREYGAERFKNWREASEGGSVPSMTQGVPDGIQG